MIQVNADGSIECFWGESGYIDIVPLISENERYFLEAGEYVVFTIASSRKTFIRKILTAADQDDNGVLKAFISHKDTMGMSIDKYKYDCKLVSPEREEYCTFIKPALFVIKPGAAKGDGRQWER